MHRDIKYWVFMIAMFACGIFGLYKVDKFEREYDTYLIHGSFCIEKEGSGWCEKNDYREGIEP